MAVREEPVGCGARPLLPSVSVMSSMLMLPSRLVLLLLLLLLGCDAVRLRGNRCVQPLVPDDSVPGDVCSCEAKRALPPPCSSQWLANLNIQDQVRDHMGRPWNPKDAEEASGVHCNVSTFRLDAGKTLRIGQWQGGGRGGRLVVEVLGGIVIEGRVDGVGRGYRGGQTMVVGDGYVGEGYSGNFNLTGRMTNDGGGGGGRSRVIIQEINPFTQFGRPGAGGGYGTAGTPGDALYFDDFSQSGKPYGNYCIKSLYPGAGGGSGASRLPVATVPASPWAGGGGNGGAALMMYSLSGSITVAASGSLDVDGQNGVGDSGAGDVCGACPAACGSGCHAITDTGCYDQAGSGGAGAGGAIFLSAATVDIRGSVSAQGGIGGVGVFNMSGCGGNGGDGRIRIDANTFTGATVPAAGQKGLFSYCPKPCTAKTTPTPVTIATTSNSLPTTDTPVFTVATSRPRGTNSGGGQGTSAGAMTPEATTGPGGTSAPPSSVQPTGAGLSVAEASLPLWLTVVIIMVGTVVLIGMVTVTVACTYRARKNRMGPAFIANGGNREDTGESNRTNLTTIAYRFISRHTTPDTSANCLVCRGVCRCPKPATFPNPAYVVSEPIIPFTLSHPQGQQTLPQIVQGHLPPSGSSNTAPPQQTRRLSDGSNAAAQSHEYSTPEGIKISVQMPNGGAPVARTASRHYSSSSVVPLKSPAAGKGHNYDLVGGGPGTVEEETSFRNPVYDTRIAINGASSAPMSPRSDCGRSVASANYENLSPDVTGIHRRNKSVTSPSSSSANIPMDASGYLIADSQCIQNHHHANGGPGVGGGMRRDEHRMPPLRSPPCECARCAAMSPNDVFHYPDPAQQSGVPMHDCTPSITSGPSSGSPRSQSSMHEPPPEPVRKDSGIELDSLVADANGCYAVSPLDRRRPEQLGITAPCELCMAAEAAQRPPSAEPPMKQMSPIPEQHSSGGSSVCTEHSRQSTGGSSAGSGSVRAAPVQVDVSTHQYASISEIEPAKASQPSSPRSPGNIALPVWQEGPESKHLQAVHVSTV